MYNVYSVSDTERYNVYSVRDTERCRGWGNSVSKCEVYMYMYILH